MSPASQRAWGQGCGGPAGWIGGDGGRGRHEDRNAGLVAFAQRLCDKAGLTLEQKVRVALIARGMALYRPKEAHQRANLTEAQRRALARGAAEHALIPLDRQSAGAFYLAADVATRTVGGGWRAIAHV